MSGKQIYFGKILIKNTATGQKRTIEDIFREDQTSQNNQLILNRIRRKFNKKEAANWVIDKYCIETAKKVGLSIDQL